VTFWGLDVGLGRLAEGVQIPRRCATITHPNLKM